MFMFSEQLNGHSPRPASGRRPIGSRSPPPDAFGPARGPFFVGRSKNEQTLEINHDLPGGAGKRSLPVPKCDQASMFTGSSPPHTGRLRLPVPRNPRQCRPTFRHSKFHPLRLRFPRQLRHLPPRMETYSVTNKQGKLDTPPQTALRAKPSSFLDPFGRPAASFRKRRVQNFSSLNLHFLAFYRERERF
jgi:hypothetical protein